MLLCTDYTVNPSLYKHYLKKLGKIWIAEYGCFPKKSTSYPKSYYNKRWASVLDFGVPLQTDKMQTCIHTIPN